MEIMKCYVCGRTVYRMRGGFGDAVEVFPRS
jgi:ribosomal protein S27E